MLQELHDHAIGGTIEWDFDTGLVGELGWQGGFTAHGRAQTAPDLARWMAETATRNTSTPFEADDLAAIQNLQQLEINGVVTWYKPEEGFHVDLYGVAVGDFASWTAAEEWLRSQSLGGATEQGDRS